MLPASAAAPMAAPAAVPVAAPAAAPVAAPAQAVPPPLLLLLPLEVLAAPLARAAQLRLHAAALLLLPGRVKVGRRGPAALALAARPLALHLLGAAPVVLLVILVQPLALGSLLRGAGGAGAACGGTGRCVRRWVPGGTARSGTAASHAGQGALHPSKQEARVVAGRQAAPCGAPDAAAGPAAAWRRHPHPPTERAAAWRRRRSCAGRSAHPRPPPGRRCCLGQPAAGVPLAAAAAAAAARAAAVVAAWAWAAAAARPGRPLLAAA